LCVSDPHTKQFKLIYYIHNDTTFLKTCPIMWKPETSFSKTVQQLTPKTTPCIA
jgi:hypothetical protein